jgi:hypothetical protein
MARQEGEVIMRLTSIWIMRGFSFSERLHRSRERVNQIIASHLPSRLRYWVTMQMLAEASKGSSEIPATTLDYILQHLPKEK